VSSRRASCVVVVFFSFPFENSLIAPPWNDELQKEVETDRIVTIKNLTADGGGSVIEWCIRNGHTHDKDGNPYFKPVRVASATLGKRAALALGSLLPSARAKIDKSADELTERTRSSPRHKRLRVAARKVQEAQAALANI
jgi:hypothetical protein